MFVTGKFDPGQVVATQGAMGALERAGDDPATFLTRHVNGDWGDVDDHDRRVNDDAMTTGARLLSVYHLSDGTKVWVISDPEVAPGIRYATTVLLPDEY